MKRTTAWETTDGQLFNEKGKARLHQKRIDFEAAIVAFWERHGMRGMDGEDAAKLCIENAADLAPAFKLYEAEPSPEEEKLEALQEQLQQSLETRNAE